MPDDDVKKAATNLTQAEIKALNSLMREGVAKAIARFRMGIRDLNREGSQR